MYPYKQELKEVVLKAYEKACRVAAACRKAHISKSTFYRWNREDLNFHEQYIILEDKLMKMFDEKNMAK